MKHYLSKNHVRTLLLLMLGMFCTVGAFAQGSSIGIKGSVKDQKGEPVMGATLVVKGSNKATMSDMEGNFGIEAPANGTLVVTYIGYKTQEVAIGGKTNLSIVLVDDVELLEEVVVIGYGKVKKEDATGSITAIKPDKMNRGLTLSAQDMLAGKVAGVNVISGGGTPGGGAQIRIRGGSSLSASNDPLIVIDGLPMDNDGIKGVANPLSTVNPNDIATFTVLKDASATAIYGSRASNGVIIITTKRGESKSKPRISYDGNASVSVKRNSLDVLNGDEFRALATSMYSDQPDVISRLGTANTDWQDQIYRTALGTDQSITVSGGLGNTPYRLSFGYSNQDGIIETSNYERYTTSFNLNPSFLNNHLNLSLNGKGMIVNNRYVEGGVVGNAVGMDPTQPVYGVNTPGDKTDYKRYFGGYFQWANVEKDSKETFYNSLAGRNPVSTLALQNDHSNAKNFIGNAQVDYKFHFLPDLRANMNVALDISKGTQDILVSEMAARDNRYGRRGSEYQFKTNKSLDFYLQYAKELKSQKFDIMGGYAWQHFYRSGTNESVGLDNANVLVKNYNPLSTLFKTESYLVSFFGRANYTLLNRYMLTATVRNDGTSRFSKDNRWALFPSVGMGWKINEERFLKNVRALSELKLRLGYGVTGQQNISDNNYPYVPSYQESREGADYPLGGVYLPTYRPNAYNSNLKWEETTTYNGGIDFGILHNRFTASFDYYYRETKDLLNIVDISAGTNFRNRVLSNIGSLVNQGVEMSLNANVIAKKDLRWEVGYNVTYNSNEITKLTTGEIPGYVVATGGIGVGTGNNVQAHAVNHPASSFYVFQQVYDNAGKPIENLFVDRNGDGIINESDKYFYKKPAADVMMGMTSKLIYKAWDLGISLRASLGNYVYNHVEAGSANVGMSAIWSTSGFFSNRPAAALNTNFSGIGNYFMSDYYVQNASFLRCDNITVGFSFKKFGMYNVAGRVYATVQNPFVITDYKGLDPEVSTGIDRDLYPRPVVSLMGLSLNF